MAEQAITQGAIRSIFQPAGCEIDPILQCVQIKTMDPKPGDVNPVQRYRVVLSDIQNFVQTMLAISANDIVTSGQLKKGSIVRLLKYNPQQVKDKNILIILELEVLSQFGELEKIGDPKTLDTKGVQPVSISGDNFYGSKPAPAPAPQKNIPHHQSNPATSSAHPHVYPIEALSPYQNKWTIRARCTSKGDMKEWHNQKGTGKLFSVNLLDDTGEIRATAFNEAAERLFPIFQEGVVYYVSTPAKVTLAKKQFSNLPNDYEIQFDRDTEVEKAEDQDNKPQLRFNFTKIGDLSSVEKDTTIDTVGVLKEIADVTEITSKNTNKSFSKRELTIADDSQTSVRLTVWGKTAETFDAPLDSVIAFKGVKVSDFGGRSLSLLSSGSMIVEPDIDEAHKLHGWHDAVGQNVTFSTHQNLAGGASGGQKNDVKVISQVIEEEAYLQDTPTYMSLRASVLYVKDSPIAYPACSTQGCNKKVIEEAEGQWRCEKCSVDFPEPKYRYVLSMSVADHTGTMWLSLFDDAGQIVMGMPANDLMKLKDEDDSKFKATMQEATCRTYNFRVRAKMETYQDQPKPRYQVMNLYPLNFAQEANKLAQLIKQYDIGEDSLFVN